MVNFNKNALIALACLGTSATAQKTAKVTFNVVDPEGKVAGSEIVQQTRGLKEAKSPKSLKSPKNSPLNHPKSQCLAEGFSIKGPTEPQSALTLYADCCDGCADSLDFTQYDQDCLEEVTLMSGDTFLTYPFGHSFSGIIDSFQFTDEDAFLGDGSFKGSLPPAGTPGNNASDKIILSYNSLSYVEGVNEELWDRPVADLEYVEYSFKAESCGTTGSPCPQWFYLNVYTREPGSIMYYDCRYDFVPTIGGVEGQPAGEGWTTVRFNLSSPATDTRTYQSSSGLRDRCPGVGATPATPADPLSTAAAADKNYVLGTNDQGGFGTIFTLNIGHSLAGDDVSGFFDRFVIKMVDEPNPRIYDL